MVITLVFLLNQPHLLAQPCDLAEERRCIEFCNCAGAEDISSPMARRHKCSPAPVRASHCVCWRSNGKLNGRCLTLEPGQDTGTLLPCLAGEAGEGARCPQHVRRLARQLTSCSILQHQSPCINSQAEENVPINLQGQAPPRDTWPQKLAPVGWRPDLAHLGTTAGHNMARYSAGRYVWKGISTHHKAGRQPPQARYLISTDTQMLGGEGHESAEEGRSSGTMRSSPADSPQR